MSDPSLLRLFQSEYLPLHHLLYYLHHKKEPGTHAVLVNRLYSVSFDEVSAYLPQILNNILHRPDTNSLERYFLDASVHNHSLATRLYWNLHSAMGDHVQSQHILLERMVHELEMVIVNGERPQKIPSLHVPPHLFLINLEETEAEKFSHKQIRADFFNSQHKLAQTLCKLSIALIPLASGEREDQLKACIQNIDTWIKDTRFKYSDSHYSEYTKRLFRGIHLPINFEIQPTDSVLQIVKLVPSESLCFRTKARVPYKIVLETLDINDEDPVETPSTHGTEPEEHEDREDLLQGLDVETNEITDKNEERFKGFNEYVNKVEEQEANPEILSGNDVINSEDSNNLESPWGEAWEVMKERIRKESPFGNYKTWNLRGVIVKGHDDLRQEHLAMQLIQKFKSIFKAANLSIFLQPYDILVVSENSGIIELIPNAVSLHSIKKSTKNYTNLSDFFLINWDGNFEEAQKNFVESTAGYSLICYLLNIKDRHNGNILLDSSGHVIHIDFGFLFTNSPGGNINFETAPFKLTHDMVEVMGGSDSELFRYFKVLMVQGFLELRKHAEECVLMVEMMLPGERMACLQDSAKAVREFRERFHITKTDEQCMNLVDSLVNSSVGNWRTVKYDSFQRITNGIL